MPRVRGSVCAENAGRIDPGHFSVWGWTYLVSNSQVERGIIILSQFNKKKAAGMLTVRDYLGEARLELGPVSDVSDNLSLAVSHLIDAIDMIAHKRSPGAGSGRSAAPASFVEGW